MLRPLIQHPPEALFKSSNHCLGHLFKSAAVANCVATVDSLLLHENSRGAAYAMFVAPMIRWFAVKESGTGAMLWTQERSISALPVPEVVTNWQL